MTQHCFSCYDPSQPKTALLLSSSISVKGSSLTQSQEHWAPGLEITPGDLREVQAFCFQHWETATLYPSETGSFHLSRVPLNRGHSVVVPWKFLSRLSSFGSLITGYFRILLCDGYSHIIPLACIRTDFL